MLNVLYVPDMVADVFSVKFLGTVTPPDIGQAWDVCMSSVVQPAPPLVDPKTTQDTALVLAGQNWVCGYTV